MQLQPETDQGGYTIVGHRDGVVQVNGERLGRSFVVAPNRLIRDWPPRRLEELEAAHLAQLVELEPELVLLGVGDRLRFPHPELLRSLLERGIGVEVMDTAAACRTYNLLKGDGRRVVAAMITVADASDAA
jgi:uncharacterized protein